MEQRLLQNVKKQPHVFSIRRTFGYKGAWPLHTYLSTRPRLFYASLKLLGRGQAAIINPDTALVIAAVGGCGNSYALDSVKLGHPDEHFVSHQHNCVQVIQARKYAVPCLVLIRHPVDSISSYVSRGACGFSLENLEWTLKDYSFFYNTVIGLRNSFISATFQEVVTDYASIIRRLNEHSGTKFVVPENNSKAEELVRKKNKWKGFNRYYAIEDVKAALHCRGLEAYRLEAEESYKNFCAVTGLAIAKDKPRPALGRASYQRPVPEGIETASPR